MNNFTRDYVRYMNNTGGRKIYRGRGKFRVAMVFSARAKIWPYVREGTSCIRAIGRRGKNKSIGLGANWGTLAHLF